MVYYYQLKDGTLAARSARGIFIYDTYEEMWIPAPRSIYNDEYITNSKSIEEKDVEHLKQQRLKLDDEYARRLYVTGISFRNEICEQDNHPEFAESEYVNDVPVIRQLRRGKFINIKRPVTFVVGENGAGKSTLLEAFAVGMGLNGEGGDSHFEFETKRTYSHLFNMLQVRRRRVPRDSFFLRAESFYNLASAIDDGLVLGSYGKSLHQQSHGESFLALIRNRFQGRGLYILDEPEAALSPSRTIELMKEIKRLVEKDSQFIIATHSPILVTYPNAQIFELSAKGIYEKRYQELESFMLYRDFINNPEYELTELGF